MSDRTAVELGNIQKTLLLPLWGRAVESRKPHPLLVDAKAQEILTALGEGYTDLGRDLSPLTQLAWILRSLCIDDAVKAHLARHPEATVVNLACGLDTTFERVDNGRVRWFDLDLPDTMALRREFIQESPRRTFLSASMLDDDWIEVVRGGTNLFFIAAGVLYYFEEEQVRAFFVRQATQFPGSAFVCDVASPRGVKVSNKMVIKRSGLDERSFLHWGMEDPGVFSRWHPGILLEGTSMYFGERVRSLPLKIRLLGRFSDWMKIQYILHLRMQEKAREMGG